MFSISLDRISERMHILNRLHIAIMESDTGQRSIVCTFSFLVSFDSEDNVNYMFSNRMSNPSQVTQCGAKVNHHASVGALVESSNIWQ